MTDAKIQRIYLDNETIGLTVVYYKENRYGYYEPHAIAEQLYICKDGSSRRALPTDYDSGSYWGFESEDSNVDGDPMTINLKERPNGNYDDDDFNEIMDEAFEILDEKGILDEDGCIPSDAPYTLYESNEVFVTEPTDSNSCVDYDAAVNLMSDEIREKLHAKLATCTKQKFFDEYRKAHEAKYHEEFIIN